MADRETFEVGIAQVILRTTLPTPNNRRWIVEMRSSYHIEDTAVTQEVFNTWNEKDARRVYGTCIHILQNARREDLRNG